MEYKSLRVSFITFLPRQKNSIATLENKFSEIWITGIQK